MTDKPVETKDVIGYVVLSSGDKVAVCMPTMEDIEELVQGKIPSERVSYYLCAKAVGITEAEFRKYSMTDGLQIAGKLNPAMESFVKYVTGDKK